MKESEPKWINTILFDLDGVIIDSNEAIVNAWKTTAREYGCDISPEQIEKYIIGASHKYTLENIFPHFTAETRALIHRKVDQREAEAECVLIDGLKSLLFQLKSCPLNIGIVTSSWPEKINNVLDQHNLHIFSCIISRHDVVRGKPDPLPYTTAIERFNTRPEQTLVFEDSDNGIISALTAGANCIAINNTNNRDILSVRDFNSLAVDDEQLSYRFLDSTLGLRCDSQN